MSDCHPLSPYPYRCPESFSPATVAVLQSAAMGATVGAAAAVAAQLKRSDQRPLALNQIAQAGAVTGLTSAAATLVGQSLGHRRGLTRFAAMFATGAAVMYLLNPSKSGESA